MASEPQPHRIDLQSSSHPRASILIASSSRTDLLIDCLSAIAKNGSRSIPHETIVVLNGVADDAAEALQQRVSGVTLLQSPINLGLSGASNLARAHARGELLILLHDDAEIEPGWLEALVGAAEADPHAGAIGSRILFPDGRLQHAGSLLWQDGTTHSLTGPPAHDDELRRPVDYAGTCSLLIRAKVWDAFGGLDEQFFPAYYIDVNLALSVRAAGYNVVIEPRSVVRHHSGSSANRVARHFYWHTNRQLLLAKWRDALTQYSPRPDPVTDAAIGEALQRAAATAARRRAQPPPALYGRQAAFDDEQQRLSHVVRNAQLQDALVKHLSLIADSHDGALKELRDAYADVLARSERMQSVIDAQRSALEAAVAAQKAFAAEQPVLMNRQMDRVFRRIDEVAQDRLDRRLRRFLRRLLSGARTG